MSTGELDRGVERFTLDARPERDREIELAWAAGFFDGEGSVSVRRDKRPGRKPTLQLDIEQVDPRPLRRFAVGHTGSIVKREARAEGRRPIYRIAMGENRTLNTIGALWEYLSEPKREQYKRAYEATL